MALFKIDGVIGRINPSTLGLISRQVEHLKLKAVKSIVASYDPFTPNTKSTRQFVYFLSTYQVTSKNQDLVKKVRTNITCDRSEPTIAFELITGENVIFKAENLSALEMFTLYNKHISPLAPPDEAPRETLSAKAMKKSRK